MVFSIKLRSAFLLITEASMISSCFDGGFFFQDFNATVLADQFDFDIAGSGDQRGFFAAVKIASVSYARRAFWNRRSMRPFCAGAFSRNF